MNNNEIEILNLKYEKELQAIEDDYSRRKRDLEEWKEYRLSKMKSSNEANRYKLRDEAQMMISLSHLDAIVLKLVLDSVAGDPHPTQPRGMIDRIRQSVIDRLDDDWNQTLMEEKIGLTSDGSIWLNRWDQMTEQLNALGEADED